MEETQIGEVVSLRDDRADINAEGDVWLDRLIQVCKAAARGELEERVLRCDSDNSQIKILATAINDLLDIVDAYVRESGASLNAAAHGKFYRRVVLNGLQGSYKQGANQINEATGVMKNTHQMLKSAESRRLELASAFEGTVKGVIATVASSATEMMASAESLEDAAGNTSDRATSVAAAAEESSMNVKSLAAATEEFSSSIKEIYRQATDSTKIANAAATDAGKAKDMVEGLAKASERISGVVKVISKVADMTNLLALNANIEAARAGEWGRGFGVVAQEVKTLAQQTSEATKQIAVEIGDVQDATKRVVDSISSIDSTIVKMDELSRGVMLSVDEQRSVTSEISSNVNQAAQAVQDISRDIGGVNNAAKSTAEVVGQLKQAASEVSKQAESLRVISDEFLTTIRNG